MKRMRKVVGIAGGVVLAALAGTTAVPAAHPGMSAAMFHWLSGQLRVSAYDAVMSAPATDAAASSQEEPVAEGVSGSPPIDAPMVLKVRAEIETPGGFIATASLPGAADGTYAVIHANGGISALSADGSMIWNRPSRAFINRTGRPGRGSHPLTPVILLGTDPVDPFIVGGEHPYAIGDLTGDGVADVAVAHFFRAGTIAGDAKSQVSVLDGRTGDFVWSRLYPGFIMSLVIDGNTLVVADCTGNRRGVPGSFDGEDGSRSGLDAFRFTPVGGGQASVAPAWSISTGAQWVPWLALERAGPGAVAAAWTGTPVGTPDAVHGHVLRIATATGAVTWSVDTAGYPRMLRYDAARSQVVALTEDDPMASQQVGYSLLGLAAADGSTATTIVQQNALALGFQVGGGSWIVGALVTTPNISLCPDPNACLGNTGSFYTSGGLTAFDPGTGRAKWTSPLAAPRTGGAVQPYAMLTDQGAARNILIVSSFVPTSRSPTPALDFALSHPEDTQLDAIDQDSGLLLWTRSGVNLLMPLFLSPYSQAGRELAMGASSRSNLYGINVSGGVNSVVAQVIQPTTPYQMVRTFDIATGEDVQATPLLSDVHGAMGHDVNGDGVTDLIVGCESAGVFALDGRHLTEENPAMLWRATAGGAVRKLLRADLDGDGTPEVVVVASRAIDVYDATTGQLRYEIAYPNNLVWTVTLDDLDGDNRPDIIVPTTKVDAYKGSTGALMWTYTAPPTTSPNDTGIAYFSTVAATSRHDLAVEYLNVHIVPNPSDSTSENQTVVLIDGANGHELWSHSYTYPGGTLELVGGAMAGDNAPGVSGTAVAFVSVQTDDGTWLTSRPVIDVYDAATGTLAYSSTYPWVHGNAGSMFVPGVGFESFGAQPSLLASPSASVLNLYSMNITEMAMASLGRFGTHAILTDAQIAVNVAASTGFVPNGKKFVPVLARYVSPFISGGLAIQDLDGDGVDEIISYPWDVDGFQAASYQSGQSGIYPDQFLHGFSVLEVQLPNAAPIAALSAVPTSGSVPLTVALDASGSSDPDAGDAVASYTFHFGDGSDDVTQSAPALSHTYLVPGSYLAKVSVTDRRGLGSVAPAEISILALAPSDNFAPIAALTATPVAGIVAAGQRLAVTLDASGSIDGDPGDVLTYTFDFGDGSLPLTQAASAATHDYAAGIYSAKVTVTDSAGKTSDATASIVVTEAAIEPDAAPAAGGGALGWLTLLPLAGAGLARRRRP